MKRPSSRVWASVALLSVIVPVSLLATFRLTGVLREPSRSETITAETVTWTMSRPMEIISVNEEVRNDYSDGIASVGLGVDIVGYRENWGGYPSDGDDDIVDLRIIATANMSEGFIYSVAVRFSEIDAYAVLYINQNKDSMKLEGLKTKTIHWSSEYRNGAYFETTGFDEPRKTFLSIFAYWVFFDLNNTSHRATVTLEVTFYDGQKYGKILTPIGIGVQLP